MKKKDKMAGKTPGFNKSLPPRSFSKMDVEGSMPNELFRRLSIKQMYFEDVHCFTRFINQTTREFGLPYSSYYSGNSRKFQVFTCRFGGRAVSNSRFSVKSNCPSFLKYLKDENLYTLIAYNVQHNHPIDELYINGHSNCLCEEIRQKVNEEQMLSVPSGQIRQHFNILSSPDIFYNIRRKAISITKQENIDDLVDYLNSINFKSTIKRNNISNNLEDVYVINNKISKKSFAKFILFIDDTANTNIYGLPLKMVLAKDPEGLNQCLAFGLLSNKTTHSFEQFFIEIRNELEDDPQFIVVDRSLSQFIALKNAFPESFITFCLRHLGKDLVKYFSPEHDIIKGFYHVQKCVEAGYTYIEYLKETYESLETGNEIIRWMIDYEQNWLPIHLIEHGNLYDWTTNRVEGFFGNFKLHNNFKIFKITDLIQSLINYC